MASWVVLVPTAAVGAAGTPVNVGLAKGAVLTIVASFQAPMPAAADGTIVFTPSSV